MTWHGGGAGAARDPSGISRVWVWAWWRSEMVVSRGDGTIVILPDW